MRGGCRDSLCAHHVGELDFLFRELPGYSPTLWGTLQVLAPVRGVLAGNSPGTLPVALSGTLPLWWGTLRVLTRSFVGSRVLYKFIDLLGHGQRS